jgi:tryptophan-rich sensory protein
MTQTSIKKNTSALLGWLLLAFFAAGLGGLGSASAPDFYGQLNLPGWAPPAWLFGPVWSALYLMMGIASWLVWREGRFHKARLALTLYLLQLGINSLWSWLFFAWHLGAWAFVEIVILWFVLLATLVSFRTHNVLASLFLIPYLAWVTFATALAWSAWHMNPALLG